MITVRRWASWIGLGIAGASGIVCPAALASAPAAGGHYAGHARASRARFHVNLRLANDGREFANFSYVEIYDACGTGSYGFLSLDGHIAGRAVRVRSDGTFHYRSNGAEGTTGTVRGHFTRNGRGVVGSVAVRDRACKVARAGFRARLVGRPNAPRPNGVSICDPVIVAEAGTLPEDVYRVLDHGLGCTTARELARRFDASSTCRNSSANATCMLPGATCQRIRGSGYNSLNSVRCTATQQERFTELRHYRPCPFSADESVELWSLNLGCTAAATFPVEDFFGTDGEGFGPCGDVLDLQTERRCTIAGFDCRAHAKTFGAFGGFRALCIEQTDRYLGLAIDYDAG